MRETPSRLGQSWSGRRLRVTNLGTGEVTFVGPDADGRPATFDEQGRQLKRSYRPVRQVTLDLPKGAA
jgi:hypothetical protein